MSDLIDRQAAIALAKDIIVPIKDGTAYKYRCIDPDAIKELPSAEPDTVRCKDCIWRLGTDCTRFAEVPVTNEDYCSRGERKQKRWQKEC